ncbi:MAG: hypothetical protein JW943_13955 [Deltaproteobacteria bacterium]|nr:hypothetical protein [Deltaproteobacteria bacterium]
MKKIVILTEGQSELIFVRHCLLILFDNSKLSFDCIKLYSNEQQIVPYSYKGGNADIFFLIVNVGNDDRVVSAIKERERHFFQKGYEYIIGIRDMYSTVYDKKSGGKIKRELTSLILREMKTEINKMSSPENISIHYSIMEFEVWVLSMYDLFLKLHKRLTLKHIEGQIGFNLSAIDPQEVFYKPSSTLSAILRSVSINYNKSANIIEKLTSLMDQSDIDTAVENNRCQSLNTFYHELLAFRDS